MSERATVPSVLSTSEGLNRAEFTPLDWTLFLSVSLIWGSSFVLMDIGLDALSPGVITWLRVALGAAALNLSPHARVRIEPADRLRLVVLSFVWVAIPFTLFPLAQQHIDSAVAGMLNGAMPLFAATLAALMLRRLPRGPHLVGLLVGFVGVVAISLPTVGEGTSEALGVVLVLIATLCYGFAVNIATPIQQRYGSMPLMAKMLTLAAIWTLPFAVADVGASRFAWGPFAAIAFAGVVGTGAAFVIMATLVGRVGSTRASFITYLIPVVALALGVAFRGDRVSGLAVVGVVLVIAGALLASRRDR